MKRLFISIAFVLITNILFPQDYYAFPTKSCEWREVIETTIGPGTGKGEIYSHKIIGDTLINGMVCSKIYKEIGSLKTDMIEETNIEYLGAIQEDSSRRVYIIQKGSTIKKLLYDFNIKVGDTLQQYTDPNCCYFYGGSLGDYVVRKIDSTLILDKPRKRYNIRITNNPQGFDNLEFIEGIGSIYGLLNQKGITGGYSAWLLWFKQDVQLIYCRDGQCNPNTLEINSLSPQISCFPNPTSGALEIEGLPNIILELSLINYLGQKVYINSIDGINTKIYLDLSNLNPGLYMLLLFKENELLHSEKIIRL